MTPINIITDGYERKARLYPALWLISPVIVTGVALLTAKFSMLQSLAGGVVGCGGAFLLTQLARDADKKHEASLFAKWGGLPSVTIFRHRDSRLDSITKTRYHKKLAALVKEAKAPTPEQEQKDPAAADAVYTAWSNYLRVNTRDTKKFVLLFQENVAYGCRRNLWGLRALGITATILSLLVCGLRLYFIHSSTGNIDEALGGRRHLQQSCSFSGSSGLMAIGCASLLTRMPNASRRVPKHSEQRPLRPKTQGRNEPQRIHRRRRRPGMVRGAGLCGRARTASRAR